MGVQRSFNSPFVFQPFNSCGDESSALIYVAGMRITHAQAAKLHEQVGRELRYFRCVRQRLEKIGYTLNDPLCNAAYMAENAVLGLSVLAHYASCKSGVCRAEESAAGLDSPEAGAGATARASDGQSGV
jgi:hypothetical protein